MNYLIAGGLVGALAFKSGMPAIPLARTLYRKKYSQHKRKVRVT